MSEEFDPNKLFDDVHKETLKKGYGQLKDIIFKVFTSNSYLEDDENVALTKDMLHTNTGMRYDSIVELWFKQWKFTQGKR